jgi:hypothetical protein
MTARDITANQVIRDNIDGLPVATNFSMRDVHRWLEPFHFDLTHGLRDVHAQCRCELERIRDGGRARFAETDRCIVYGWMQRFGTCPLDLWRELGGEGEPGRGRFINCKPGDARARWWLP